MFTLLEIKKQGGDWHKLIFPVESLPLDHLDTDETMEILTIICEELSALVPKEQIIWDTLVYQVIGKLNKDDYNSCEWDELTESIYDIIIGFADIVFQATGAHATFDLLDVNDMSIEVAYKLIPLENY